MACDTIRILGMVAAIEGVVCWAEDWLLEAGALAGLVVACGVVLLFTDLGGCAPDSIVLIGTLAPIERVATRITALRTKRKWTKRQLAERAGISYGYLWRLEAARQDPTLSVLEKLATAFGVPVARLLK